MKKILILISLFLIGCNTDKIESYKPNKVEYGLKKLLLNNIGISDSISRLLVNTDNKSVLKVYFNRKENFLRITIIQALYFEDIRYVPNITINEKNKIFLCYTGHEILLNKKDDLKEYLLKNNFKLKNINEIKQSTGERYLQFDFYDWNKIEFPERKFYDFYGRNDGIIFK